MLSGAIDTGSGHPPPEQVLMNVRTTLSWDGCVIHPLESEGFWGQVLLNPALPYQPSDHHCHDKEAGLLVLMDGCIYNQQALAAELDSGSAGLTTPQLMAEAFKQWGPAFVERLNGDFAICVHHPGSKVSYLFRDHVGIRPLAFAVLEPYVYFSTDGMGLCKALFPDEPISRDYMLNQFLWGGYNQDLMPHPGVQKLKPGHYLKIEQGKWKAVRYWHPRKIREDKSLDREKVLADIKTLVHDAVQIRCDDRFRASAHMSGALDSSVVAVLARKAYARQHPFYGLSWTPLRAPMKDDLAYDERELVRTMCKRHHIIPFFADFGAEDCLGFSGEWRSTCHYLAERKVVAFAREKKINLIFSGWGGDEFVSMGNRGIDADLIKKRHLRSFFYKYPWYKPRKILAALFQHLLFPWWRRPYLRQKADPAVYPYIRQALGSNTIPRKKRFKIRSRRGVHLQLLELNHLDQRTSDWYVYGQRHGVEYRYPLLDKRLVEYMLKVPSRCLVGGNHHRILLRSIARELLPPEVADNKSKEDPVANAWQVKLAGDALEHLKVSVPEYRNNPDLNFIDWDLLEKKLPDMQPPGDHTTADNDPAILPYVKAAHGLTVGYYMDEHGSTKK